MKNPNVVSLDAHKAFNSRIEMRKVVESNLRKLLDSQKQLENLQNKRRS